MARANGRPAKLSPLIAWRIILAIRAGAYIETAVAQAGIVKQTYYNWLKLANDYAEELKDTGDVNAPAEGYDRFQSSLQDRINWERAQAEARARKANREPDPPTQLPALPWPEPKDFSTLQRGACLAFLDAVEQAAAEFELGGVEVIGRAASRGDWKAAAFLLERRHPTRWARRTKVDLLPEGDGGEEVNVSLVVKRPIAPGATAPGQKEPTPR